MSRGASTYRWLFWLRTCYVWRNVTSKVKKGANLLRLFGYEAQESHKDFANHRGVFFLRLFVAKKLVGQN